MRCEYCDGRINQRRDYELVEGWTQHRKDGGLHHLRLRTTRDKWACATCIDRLAAGISPGQEAMFT